MRKIFAVILAAAIAIFGIFFLIAGIGLFISPAKGIPSNYNTGMAITFLIIFFVSIVCLIGTITALVKVWNRNKANERALFSLATLILGIAVSDMLVWLSYKGTSSPDVNHILTVWIIEMCSGGLVLFASLEFIPVSGRRIFGVLGTLVGIVAFVIDLVKYSQTSNVDVTYWIIAIAGLVICLLGLLLSLTLKEKKKA